MDGILQLFKLHLGYFDCMARSPDLLVIIDECVRALEKHKIYSSFELNSLIVCNANGTQQSTLNEFLQQQAIETHALLVKIIPH